ncbi:MAG TPA: hypothetical protein PLR41_16620 [Alphaproteobacteria bacterium]|nr:hypothetical protein [Alphaproteobacteria bacterium]
MLFFLVTLLVAAAITGGRLLFVKETFDFGKFVARTIVTWLIVMAVVLVLFLGWCFLALSGGSFH